MKTLKLTNWQSLYILGRLSALIGEQNERIKRTRIWMEADKRDFIDEVDKLARGFTGRKRKYILGCLSGLLGNQSNPIELNVTWHVAYTSNMINQVAALSRKYRQEVVTNVNTMLPDHTVWEIESLDMALEMLNTCSCYLVFNCE